MRKGLAIALTLLSAAQAQADERHVWAAGPYSVSDELGGFTISSVSGTGLQDDPIVVTQEFTSSSPVTLVIRALKPGQSHDDPRDFATGTLRIRLETLNNSGQAWSEFEFELQEILHQPSVFGDGLSFDQRTEDKETISSDGFAKFRRDFEPYDRLLFRDGKVDPGETVGFSFLITDYTPRTQFYLVLDPRIPFT